MKRSNLLKWIASSFIARAAHRRPTKGHIGGARGSLGRLGRSPINPLLVIVLAAIVPAGALSGCKQASFSKDGTRYFVGTVNGVKLRIPDYYLFPKKVIYEGEPHDGLGPASEGATQDSRIINFGILLRVSNLQPIRTEQDRRDWVHSQHVWADSSWMMVDFDNIYPIVRNPNPWHYMLPRYGPFDRDANLKYGLIHYESIQSIDDGMRDNNTYGHVEYFFDLPTLTSIECETNRTVIKPFKTFTTCHHHFFISELNLMVEAFYTKKDIPRWREIEARVREIAHTFIVGPEISKTTNVKE